MSAKDEGSPSKRPYSFDDIRATCCSRPGGREQHGKRESAKTSSDEEGAADVLTHRPATGPAGPTVHGTCKPEGGGPPAHPPDAPGPRRTEPATTAARPGAPGQTPEPSRRRPGTASSRRRGTPRRKPAPRAGRANPPTRCAGHRPAHRVHPPHLPGIQEPALRWATLLLEPDAQLGGAQKHPAWSASRRHTVPVALLGLRGTGPGTRRTFP